MFHTDIPKAAKFWCNATAIHNVKKTMWKRQCEKDNVRKTIVNNDRFVKQKKREAHTMWERQWSVKTIFQFGTTLMFPMYIKKDVSIGKHWYSQCI